MRMTTNVLEQSVVVFSKNYLPLSRINIKRAIALLVIGKAEAMPLKDQEDAAGWQVRSPNSIFHVPNHIRLTVASTERLWKIPAVSRREILRRDHHTCQYCGGTKHLTIDHIIPRSKGGKHTWDNVVVACERCNQHKERPHSQ